MTSLRIDAPWHRLPARLRGLVAELPHSVLLETSRGDALNRHSYLFLAPKRVLVACTPQDLPGLFRDIDAALDERCHVAGFLAYEAGYPLLGIPCDPAASAAPLAWFGVYPPPYVFDHRTGSLAGAEQLPGRPDSGPRRPWMPEDEPASRALSLNIPEAAYADKIREIQRLIARGETYQVNFTDHVSFPARAAAELYARLADQQAGSYGAYLNFADRQILSFSPELFFQIDGSTITTRPMKGTMPRGLDGKEDDAQAQRLRHDAKNRAEHVMIVDLLRNDLGRICRPGSVQVSNGYAIERYQTLHQMTSTVTGTLRPHTSYEEIFRSLFPCGSITGAPKIRTMQIIRALERGPRGAYTGAIGFIAPDGRATFNVAIRTLVLQGGMARMGVGGGIVADSDPRDEYRECLLKASFLTRKPREFALLETIRWQDEYRLLDHHLDRLEASADYFGFRLDRDTLRLKLQQLSAGFKLGTPRRVRLTLAASGEVTLQSIELVVAGARGLVRVATARTASGDVLRRHKTTDRDLYDRCYAQAVTDGFDDVLFMNERDEMTEGAISNLFVEKNGLWLTPPVECGVLPGVMRRHLLETLPTAREEILRLPDIETADALYVCNMLRGLRRVQLVRDAIIISR